MRARVFFATLLLLSSSLFYFYPEIDIMAASIFYRDGHFFLTDKPWLNVINHSAKYLCAVFAVIMLYYAFKKYMATKSLDWRQYRNIIYVAAVISVGPGIVIHPILKDNWGRARPMQVQEFGGDMQFTPAFVISNQCYENCSFVSGHAAVGFMFFAIAFLYAGRKHSYWTVFAITLGAFYGLARMMKGAHFLSDVVVSGVITYLTALLLFYIIKPQPLDEEERH